MFYPAPLLALLWRIVCHAVISCGAIYGRENVCGWFGSERMKDPYDDLPCMQNYVADMVVRPVAELAPSILLCVCSAVLATGLVFVGQGYLEEYGG